MIHHHKPGTPGQHIRAQRKANRLLALCYRQQDQFGRWLTAHRKRKWKKYLCQVEKLGAKFDLKIGVIEEAPEEFREAQYPGNVIPFPRA